MVTDAPGVGGVAGRADLEKSVRKRRSDAERNAAQILDAAAEVLARDPRASMRDIAEASGLGRATLYRHYATREAVIIAIRLAAMAESANALSVADLGRGSALEALDRVVRALIDVGDRWLVLADEATTHPDLADLEGETRAQLVNLVERGQQEGALRNDLSAAWLTEMLVCTVKSAIGKADTVSGDPASLVISTYLLGAGAGPR